MSIFAMIILAICVIGGVAILYIVCRAAGVEIPQWFVQILLIIALIVVAVFAVKLIAGMI